MPALRLSQFVGEITWLGFADASSGTLQSMPQNKLDLKFAGAIGEKHSGMTRLSCSRVKSVWPVGTPIRNVRQLSILSQEEVSKIAAGCKLAGLDPALLGPISLCAAFLIFLTSHRLRGFNPPMEQL